MLRAHPKPLPAGGDHLHRRGVGQQLLDEVGGGVQHVFAVVQHQQQPPARKRLGDARGHRQARLRGDTQHGGHRVRHRRRVADRGQLHEPHAVSELAGQLGRDLERQAGLAHPTHPRQRHQPMGSHQFGQLPSPRSSRPTKLVAITGRFPGTASSVRSGGNSTPQPARRGPGTDARHPTGPAADAHPDRPDPPPTPPPPSTPPPGSGRHDRRPSPVPSGSTPDRNSPRRDAQPHRWRSPCAPAAPTALRIHRRVDRGAGRTERSAHPVTGVLEQPTRHAPRSPSAAPRHAEPTPTRIASGSDSQRRVEPSISVNRNVTVPDGRDMPLTTTPRASSGRLESGRGRSALRRPVPSPPRRPHAHRSTASPRAARRWFTAAGTFMIQAVVAK